MERTIQMERGRESGATDRNPRAGTQGKGAQLRERVRDERVGDEGVRDEGREGTVCLERWG